MPCVPRFLDQRHLNSSSGERPSDGRYPVTSNTRGEPGSYLEDDRLTERFAPQDTIDMPTNGQSNLVPDFFPLLRVSKIQAGDEPLHSLASAVKKLRFQFFIGQSP